MARMKDEDLRTNRPESGVGAESAKAGRDSSPSRQDQKKIFSISHISLPLRQLPVTRSFSTKPGPMVSSGPCSVNH